MSLRYTDGTKHHSRHASLPVLARQMWWYTPVIETWEAELVDHTDGEARSPQEAAQQVHLWQEAIPPQFVDYLQTLRA